MERFNTATIAAVTGFSRSSITAWASLRKLSTKDGLTLPEIIEFLNAPKKNDERGKVDEKAAVRLRMALEVMGAMPGEFALEGE